MTRPKSWRFRAVMISELGTSLCSVPVFAQTVDWRDGTFGHLSKHIATDDYDAVLQDSAVAQMIEAMLGEQTATLTERLVVHGPIGFSGTCLELAGNAVRQGGDQMAYVAVCPSDGTVEVALAADGAIDVYAATSNYAHVSHGLRQWIGHYLNNYATKGSMPSNVNLRER